MKKIDIIVRATEKNFGAVSESKDLNGIIIATAKTLDEVKKEFQSALDFHIEGCKEDGDIIPEYILQNKFELNYKLEISALLLDVTQDVSLVAISKASGINEKQLGHYKTGEKIPRPAQREKIIQGIHKIGEKLTSVV